MKDISFRPIIDDIKLQLNKKNNKKRQNAKKYYF